MQKGKKGLNKENKELKEVLSQKQALVETIEKAKLKAKDLGKYKGSTIYELLTKRKESISDAIDYLECQQWPGDKIEQSVLYLKFLAGKKSELKELISAIENPQRQIIDMNNSISRIKEEMEILRG